MVITRRLAPLPVAVLLALLLPASVAAQVDSIVYVPDVDTGAIARVSTATRQATLPLNLGEPTVYSAATPDGRFLFVGLNTGDAIAVIDVATGRRVDTIAVSFPGALAVAPDGRFLYALDGSPAIVTIDVATHRPVGTPIALSNYGSSLAVSPDGQRLCIAHGGEGGADLVSIVNLTTHSVERAVNPDPAHFNAPLGAIFSSDGRSIYVALAAIEAVARIDVNTGHVDTPIPVGNFPFTLALTRDDRLLYVAKLDAMTPLVAVDTSTRARVPVPTFSATNLVGFDLALTPNGRELYVSHSRGTALTVIDAMSQRLLDTVRLPPPGFPFPLVMGPPTVVAAATPLVVMRDADLTLHGFGAFLPFAGGTLSLAADWSTTRAVSLLAAGVFGAGGTIDTGNFSAAIDGSIFGEGGLTKRGAGTLTIGGSATHRLGTSVQFGTLIVNGRHDGPITLELMSTLGGNGRVHTVELPRGGRIDPGPINGVGTLVANSIVMTRDTRLFIDLHGEANGTFDRLAADRIALGNANLLLRPAFTPRRDTTFTIVARRDGDGTFAGLAEGQVFHTTRGDFRINYNTGTNGHDVRLTTVATPTHTAPTITGLVNHIVPAGTEPTPIVFTVADDLTRADLLTVTVTSSNPDVVQSDKIDIQVNGGTRTLLAALTPNTMGTTTIAVTVSDGDLTTTQSFELSVEFSYLLAEGATGRFFDTDLLIANPHDRAAPIRITFLPQDGQPIVLDRTLAATSRTTIRVDEQPGLESVAGVSALVTTAFPIVVERTMRWDASGYGSHTDKATAGAATRWYFAEGSQGFFSTFFLLVNPEAAANTAHVTYFREGQSPVQRSYAIGPSSRLTIDASTEATLVDTSFGALVEFDRPGVAERAMYFGRNPLWTGGHDSAGVTAPATSWFLAEGATGGYFSTYVLLANPNDQNAAATLTFLPANGAAVTKQIAVPAGQRVTIDIATQDPTLADAAVATRVQSDLPLVVERAQYWPNPTWHEAHDSFGVTETATRWGLAEGRVGGPEAYQTYILLANPGTVAADVTVTFLRTTGAPLTKTFRVAPESRFNVAITGPGPATLVPELVDESFGAVIDSTQPIAVERSLYNNANGVVWAAGTNATATRLP